MTRLIGVLAACVATAVTAAAGYSLAAVVAPASQAAVADTTINVSAIEYAVILSAPSAPAGTIHFVVTNNGSITHDFSIAGKKTPILSPGQTFTLTVDLSAGQYPYLCTVGEHAIYGMQGVFDVTAAPKPTTTATTTTATTGTTTRATTTSQTTTASPPPAPTQTVKVLEKEFSITLMQGTKRITWVKPGTVRFVVKNVGKIPHNFVIAGHQTLVLAPGKSQSLVVALKQGKYRYLCSITGHAALGMKGVLTVAKTAPKSVKVKTTTVKVTMREFKFVLSRSKVPRGIVLFKLTNRGRLSHDFKIAGHKSKLVKPRKTATLRVRFTKKGRYRYICTVPGHAAAGTKGTLVVT
jgi:uncharacterized cupredoxin-like copper-binding protein